MKILFFKKVNSINTNYTVPCLYTINTNMCITFPPLPVTVLYYDKAYVKSVTDKVASLANTICDYISIASSIPKEQIIQCLTPEVGNFYIYYNFAKIGDGSLYEDHFMITDNRKLIRIQLNKQSGRLVCDSMSVTPIQVPRIPKEIIDEINIICNPMQPSASGYVVYGYASTSTEIINIKYGPWYDIILTKLKDYEKYWQKISTLEGELSKKSREQCEQDTQLEILKKNCSDLTQLCESLKQKSTQLEETIKENKLYIDAGNKHRRLAGLVEKWNSDLQTIFGEGNAITPENT